MKPLLRVGGSAQSLCVGKKFLTYNLQLLLAVSMPKQKYKVTKTEMWGAQIREKLEAACKMMTDEGYKLVSSTVTPECALFKNPVVWLFWERLP